MTLGEYARQIAAVILKHGQESSTAIKLIAATEGKLLERNIPAADRKWFWGEVANQLAAQRPVADVALGGDGLSRARDKVLEHLGRING
jgi:hypothetical protein